MKVLQVAASMSAEWGGPVSVVAELTAALRERGVESTVFAASGRRVGSAARPVPGVKMETFRTGLPARLWTAYAPGMAAALREAVRAHDLVHIHELWHYPHFAAARAARKAGRPYIVTIHGELDPWALAHRAWKKRLYLALVQRRVLRAAATLHAITSEETRQVRRQGIETPVAVIPNGIRPEAFSNDGAATLPESLRQQLRQRQVVLFFGRLHRKKGLDLLVQAFGGLARERDDAVLVIAGPDEDGYRAKVEAMARRAGIAARTVFTGMLAGGDKSAMLRAADVFVLPSYSEGFSMAVLEAMASGLPVVISRYCYFPEVADAGAGIVIDADAGELAEALRRVLDRRDEREAMGKRGRDLVLARYTWSSVAERMRGLYEATLGGRPSE